VTTCTVQGGACNLANPGSGFQLDPFENTMTDFTIVSAINPSSTTSGFNTSSVGAFGTYTSLNGGLVTLTVAAAAAPEPASLALLVSAWQASAWCCARDGSEGPARLQPSDLP
jgi:hypothetical protein